MKKEIFLRALKQNSKKWNNGVIVKESGSDQIVVTATTTSGQVKNTHKKLVCHCEA